MIMGNKQIINCLGDTAGLHTVNHNGIWIKWYLRNALENGETMK